MNPKPYLYKQLSAGVFVRFDPNTGEYAVVNIVGEVLVHATPKQIRMSLAGQRAPVAGGDWIEDNDDDLDDLDDEDDEDDDFLENFSFDPVTGRITL